MSIYIIMNYEVAFIVLIILLLLFFFGVRIRNLVSKIQDEGTILFS